MHLPARLIHVLQGARSLRPAERLHQFRFRYMSHATAYSAALRCSRSRTPWAAAACMMQASIRRQDVRATAWETLRVLARSEDISATSSSLSVLHTARRLARIASIDVKAVRSVAQWLGIAGRLELRYIDPNIPGDAVLKRGVVCSDSSAGDRRTHNGRRRIIIDVPCTNDTPWESIARLP